MKMPPVTGTAAVAALRLSVAEVTFGIIVAGTAPPEIVIGTAAAAAPTGIRRRRPIDAHT